MDIHLCILLGQLGPVLVDSFHKQFSFLLPFQLVRCGNAWNQLPIQFQWGFSTVLFVLLLLILARSSILSGVSSAIIHPLAWTGFCRLLSWFIVFEDQYWTISPLNKSTSLLYGEELPRSNIGGYITIRNAHMCAHQLIYSQQINNTDTYTVITRCMSCRSAVTCMWDWLCLLLSIH